MANIKIICPECKTEIIIDKETGNILISTKPKAQDTQTLEERLKSIKEEKEKAEDLFKKELQTLKDKERILEEKFKEAFKKLKEEKEKE